MSVELELDVVTFVAAVVTAVCNFGFFGYFFLGLGGLVFKWTL